MNDDLISRKALLEQECFMDDDNGFRCSVVLSTDVRRAPAIEVKDLNKYHLDELSRTIHYKVIEAEPVRHGRWIPGSDKHAFLEECSVCGEGVLWDDGRQHQYNYCPHCGAKMDGAADDADALLDRR